MLPAVCNQQPCRHKTHFSHSPPVSSTWFRLRRHSVSITSLAFGAWTTLFRDVGVVCIRCKKQTNEQTPWSRGILDTLIATRMVFSSNLKLHHGVYKTQQVVVFLSQFNWVHANKPYFLNTHFNIILPQRFSNCGLQRFATWSAAVRRRFRKKKHCKKCIRHWTNEKYTHTCLC